MVASKTALAAFFASKKTKLRPNPIEPVIEIVSEVLDLEKEFNDMVNAMYPDENWIMDDISIETDPSVIKYGKHLSLKVVDLTDERYDQIIIDKYKKINKEAEKRAANVSIKPRPSESIDKDVDDLKEDLIEYEQQLIDLKQSLETAPKKPGGKYVPPSMRQQMVDSAPEVTRMENIIRNTKNEIQKMEDKIKVLNDEWEQKQRRIIQDDIAQEIELSGM